MDYNTSYTSQATSVHSSSACWHNMMQLWLISKLNLLHYICIYSCLSAEITKNKAIFGRQPRHPPKKLAPKHSANALHILHELHKLHTPNTSAKHSHAQTNPGTVAGLTKPTHITHVLQTQNNMQYFSATSKPPMLVYEPVTAAKARLIYS